MDKHNRKSYRSADLADVVAEIADVSRSEAKRLIKAGAVVSIPKDQLPKYHKVIDLKKLEEDINKSKIDLLKG